MPPSNKSQRWLFVALQGPPLCKQPQSHPRAFRRTSTVTKAVCFEAKYATYCPSELLTPPPRVLSGKDEIGVERKYFLLINLKNNLNTT